VVKRDRPSPASLPPSGSEKVELFDSMLAYAGTYTLHNDHVVHHVDASWNQAFTGIDMIRFYKLDGSMLEIWGAPAPDPYTGRTGCPPDHIREMGLQRLGPGHLHACCSKRRDVAYWQILLQKSKIERR
jgi:Lipocalin-like domain